MEGNPENYLFDVAIIGAGPAGTTCAMELEKAGLKTAIIEKGVFPRDKICGDALSLDVINQLQKIDGINWPSFLDIEKKKMWTGVTFFAPNGKNTSIPINNADQKKAGYVVAREVFDSFLFNEMKRTCPSLQIFCNTSISNIIQTKNGWLLSGKAFKLTAKVIIGADGANSIVAKKVAKLSIAKKHKAAAIRCYYENLSGFSEGNNIELYFLKELLPGYLWVFPMANNSANVGLGLLSSVVQKKKINLKQLLKHILTTHPELKLCFANAKASSKIQGFSLPLGGKKRSIGGHNWLLLGDAAALIDPISGEGIGNAIRSGRLAAKHVIAEMHNVKPVDTLNFNGYQTEVYKQMGQEFKLSRWAQRIAKYPVLTNYVINNLLKKEALIHLLTDNYNVKDIRKYFINPFKK